MNLKILFSFILIFISGSLVTAQISPGELAEVHKHLEGMANCTQCHTLGDKVSNEKCLDCHKEINERINNKKGYHFSVEVREKQCVQCHNDHHGRNFEIIRFDKDKFDHKLTGFDLIGAHAKKKCEDCHKPDFITDEKVKEKKSTYLGVGTNCLNCHEDYHQKTLSVNCNNCHGQEKFKPVEKFDHNKAKFALLGKHQEVECIKCHRIDEKNGKKYQEFAGLQFANCTACHKDVHQNQFGQDCIKCHSEQSFHVIKNLDVFNHDLTAFKLEGRHEKVECKKCHKTNYTDPLKHERCTDCHIDFHKGEFDRPEKKADCAACHSVNSFKEFSFTIDQHNAGAFVLSGSHIATPCIACHFKNETWKFREIGKVCKDCHKDIHENFIDPKYYPESDCRRCHDVNLWKEVVFDHNLTNFKLEGAHVKKSCRSCHFRETEDKKVKQEFSKLSTKCTNCHKDNHNGQFETDGVTDCLRCHTSNDWKVKNFDHSKTRFPLDGKHEKVSCTACHKKVENEPFSYVKYKFEDISCEACHH